MQTSRAVAHAGSYERRRPEATLLYRLVERHYPAFVGALGAQGRSLPGYVQQEFVAHLKCGRLEHGLLRVRCAQCHAERLVAFSCRRRGSCPSCAARRMTKSTRLIPFSLDRLDYDPARVECERVNPVMLESNLIRAARQSLVFLVAMHGERY